MKCKKNGSKFARRLGQPVCAESESELGALKTADNLSLMVRQRRLRTTEVRRSPLRSAFEQPPDSTFNPIFGIEHGGACHEDIGAGFDD